MSARIRLMKDRLVDGGGQVAGVLGRSCTSLALVAGNTAAPASAAFGAEAARVLPL